MSNGVFYYNLREGERGEGRGERIVNTQRTL